MATSRYHVHRIAPRSNLRAGADNSLWAFLYGENVPRGTSNHGSDCYSLPSLGDILFHGQHQSTSCPCCNHPFTQKCSTWNTPHNAIHVQRPFAPTVPSPAPQTRAFLIRQTCLANMGKPYKAIIPSMALTDISFSPAQFLAC